MKEEVRIKIVEDYQKKLSELQQKIEILEKLKETEEVKEYLRITHSLVKASNQAQGVFYNTDKTDYDFEIFKAQIMEHSFWPYYHECEHEVSLELLNNQKVNNTYYCLDCGAKLFVDSNKEAQTQSKKTLKLNVTKNSINLIRNAYFELLSNYSSEEAISILKRKFNN